MSSRTGKPIVGGKNDTDAKVTRKHALATQECRRVIGEIEQAAGRVAQGKAGSVDEAERKRVGSAATVGESPLSPVARL